MRQAVVLLILLSVFCGCSHTRENFSVSKSRYRGVSRQTEYLTMRMPVTSENIIGKSKDQVRSLMGKPARVEQQAAKGLDDEAWMYYPESTNNFIAIIIRFTGETATTCQYESVM